MTRLDTIARTAAAARDTLPERAARLSTGQVRVRASTRASSTVDDDLYHAARGGDALAMERMLDALRPWLLRFLRIRLDAHPEADALGDDIVQEVLLYVSTHVARCEAPTSSQFLAWLRVVTLRRIADERRRAFSVLDPGRVSLSHPVLNADCEETDALSEEAWRADEPSDVNAARAAVQAAVFAAHAHLDAATAELLWRRLVQGARWPDLALETATSESAIRRRYERAILRLRTKAIRALCIVPSAVAALVGGFKPATRRERSSHGLRAPRTKSDPTP